MAQKITSPPSPPPFFCWCFLHFNFKEPGYQTVLHTYIWVWWPSTTCTMHICCWLYETWALFLATLIQTLNKSCCLAISFAFSVKPLKTVTHCMPVVYIYIYRNATKNETLPILRNLFFSLCTLNTLVKMFIFVCLVVFSSPYSIFMSICLWRMSGSICYTLKT